MRVLYRDEALPARLSDLKGVKSGICVGSEDDEGARHALVFLPEGYYLSVYSDSQPQGCEMGSWDVADAINCYYEEDEQIYIFDSADECLKWVFENADNEEQV